MVFDYRCGSGCVDSVGGVFLSPFLLLGKLATMQCSAGLLFKQAHREGDAYAHLALSLVCLFLK